MVLILSFEYQSLIFENIVFLSQKKVIFGVQDLLSENTFIKSYNGAGSKLHEGTKLHGGKKLHEDKIARRVKFARRRFCTKTNLHEATKLHKDKFALRVNFARRVKFARLSNLHGGQICTG